MPIPFELLAAEVLGLPAEQRSELLDRLLASLESTACGPEWAHAWASEVDRREAEIDAGRATWVSGDEVVARLRAGTACP